MGLNKNVLSVEKVLKKKKVSKYLQNGKAMTVVSIVG